MTLRAMIPSVGTGARLAALLAAALLALAPALTRATSLLAQQPLFAVSAVEPNVMLVVDDSNSMESWRLPSAIGDDLARNWRFYFNSNSNPVCDSERGSVQYVPVVGRPGMPAGLPTTRCVDISQDLTLRTASLNPLAYNPAVHYKPWNNNGTRFPNASLGGTGTVFSGTTTEREARRWPNGTAIPAGNGPFSDFNVEIFQPNPDRYILYRGLDSEGYVRAAGIVDLFTNLPPVENTSLVCPVNEVPEYSTRCRVELPCVQWQRQNCSNGTDFFPSAPNPASIRCPDPRQESGFAEYSASCSARGACPPGELETYQSGSTCPVARQPVGNGTYTDHPTPARYYVYTGGDRLRSNSYRMVEVDRAKPRDYANPVNRYPVVNPDGSPGTRAGSEPGQCVGNGGDGSWCSFEEEAQNYANWFLYYRTRLFASIGVTSEVLSAMSGSKERVRLGFGRINYFPRAADPWNVRSGTLPAALPEVDGVASKGTILRGVRSFTAGTPERQQMFDLLFKLNWNNSTPNREAVTNVGTYFTRSDQAGPWGDQPGTSSGRDGRDQLWCRRSNMLLVTDGEWTKVDTGFNPPPQPLLERDYDAGALDPAGGRTGTVLNASTIAGPALTGSDKVTNAPLNYQFDPAAAAELSWKNAPNADALGTLADSAFYFWGRDLRADLRNSIDRSPKDPAFWQHMSTYVIGYGVSTPFDSWVRPVIAGNGPVGWPRVDTSATLITGGNRIEDTLKAALMSRGEFYSAANPEQLRAAVSAAFDDIIAQQGSGTGVAVSSSTIAAGDVFIQVRFTTDTWLGDVRAFDSQAMLEWLAGRATQPQPVWSFRVPSFFNARSVFTSSAIDSPTPFRWAALTTDQKAVLNNEPRMLDWFLGDPTREERNGGPFRNRRDGVLGDVVNSTPMVSRAADWSYKLRPAAAANATSYADYVTAKKNTRVPVVMFGANDGMFHIVDARPADVRNGPDPADVAGRGMELFAYVPRAAWGTPQTPLLSQLASPTYRHRYFVDGPVIEGDVFANGRWRTIAVGALGAGGRGLFALDISQPEQMAQGSNLRDVVLWDITDGDESDLGNVLGAGVIGSLKDSSAPNGSGRWVAIVPNGYESASNRAVLLVLDAVTGRTIRKIDTGVGDAGTPNGLGAVTPVYDGSRNIIAIYAGDRLGNLWKFDLRSADSSQWTIFNEANGRKPLFTALADGDRGTPQPITSAPRITLHPRGGLYVVFGTGKLFETGDDASLELQSMYGLRDTFDRAPLSADRVRTLSMENYAIPGVGEGRRFRAGEVDRLDWNIDRGWRIDLKSYGGSADGERVLSAPILDAGVVSVTSFRPSSQGDLCIPGGTSFLYRLDLAGNFSRGSFNGDSSVIARQVNPGTVGGLAPLYVPLNPSNQPVLDSMTQTDVQAMLNNPKYKVVGGTPIQQGATGVCTHVALRVDGTVASVPTNCAGMLPMRVFRPIR